MPPVPTAHKGSMEWAETKGLKIKKISKGADFFSTFYRSNGDWLDLLRLGIKKDETVRTFLADRSKSYKRPSRVYAQFT